jgi:hypothetical protein
MPQDVNATSLKLTQPKIELVGHKAVYDIKLTRTKSSSQIINISGTMNFSWKPSCEGWITDHHFKLRYDYADTKPMVIESNYVVFESFDGKNLQFSSSQKEDGKIIEGTKGSATPLKAQFTIPQSMKFDLKKTTMFPTAFSMGLLHEAKQGKRFYNAQVFDGSEIEGPMEINSIIAASKTGQIYLKATSKDKNINSNLLTGLSWPIRMAFFREEQQESIADYEMSLILHENGIISDMIIDYPDFSMQQKLVSLDEVPAETCGHSTKP